ncbi:glycosyltransferase [Candidatus Magnetomorum sp. HK-1]|nr:glycosyltransferase [Candidatus Magnetomorum sp. HK-1]
MINVSVIIPMYNARKYIAQTIESLITQTYPNEKYEIIIVDNGSNDGSLEIASKYPVRLLTEKKSGAYAARNTGIAAALGNIIAFTDADCIPKPDWIELIVKELSISNTQVVLGYRRAVRDQLFINLLEKYEDSKHQYVFSSDHKELYYAHTNNMGVRSSLFKKIGKFPEINRGGDSIFVRQVVDHFGCDSVRYCKDIEIIHAEIWSIFTYYSKMAKYAYYRQRHYQITNTKTIYNRDRWQIFLATRHHYSLTAFQSLILLLLLFGGLLAWNVGDFMGLLHRC